MIRCTLVLLLLYLSIENVAGLNCYQCNSTLDHNCGELFDHNLENHPVQPEECTIYLAQYCVKVTGLWGGIVGTHRFCSSKDLGDRCQDIVYPNHDRRYRACVNTCSADNCNSAATLWTTKTIVLMVVTILASMMLMYY